MPNALDGVVQLALGLLPCSLREQQQQATPSQQGSSQPAAVAPAAGSSSAAVEDILVKLLRLLGNAAMDETAGCVLACSEAVVRLVAGVLQGYEFEQQEELVLNAAAALTNLAFYQEPGNQFFSLEPSVLLRPLLPLLTSGNDEAVIEAARAVSNLARGSSAVQTALLHCGVDDADGSARQPPGSVYEELVADSPGSENFQTSSYTSSAGSSLPVGGYVLQALVLLLGHSSWEVVYNVAGALLNLTATTGNAAALHKVNLVQELFDALQRTSSSLPCDSEDSQQQQRAAAQAAVAVAATSWMLQAAELVLQCLANMVVMQTSFAQTAFAATAASGDALGTASAGSSAPVGWLAAKELLKLLEAQLDIETSAHYSLRGLVQLVQDRLTVNA
ncbi:hypothetical protein COO60DRAFT_289829 [Scenedesmus sp. NREL 46B-D3]|nr:hypothetical protein COO60DRAFT_289829 [Scenedesmus sp. NREL 46B-D3]